MLFMTMWMELKDIKLSDVSHTEKEKYCMILFTCEILKKAESIETVNRMVVTRGWVLGRWGEGT